jgi:hypothetical protein
LRAAGGKVKREWKFPEFGLDNESAANAGDTPSAIIVLPLYAVVLRVRIKVGAFPKSTTP